MWVRSCHSQHARHWRQQLQRETSTAALRPAFMALCSSPKHTTLNQGFSAARLPAAGAGKGRSGEPLLDPASGPPCPQRCPPAQPPSGQLPQSAAPSAPSRCVLRLPRSRPTPGKLCTRSHGEHLLSLASHSLAKHGSTTQGCGEITLQFGCRILRPGNQVAVWGVDLCHVEYRAVHEWI